MMKAAKKETKIIAPLFLLIAILTVGFIYQFNKDQLQDIRGRAEDDDANYCANNCGGDRDPCTGTKIGDNFYDPGCCGEIKKTGDPFACGNWVNRTWCFPDDCTTIPEGVKTQRCAGARTEYCNRCKAHDCYTLTSAPTPTPMPVTATPIPIPTSVPTEVPQPTNPPPPTQLPEQPRSKPQITYIPIVVPPYTPPTVTPTPSPFRLNLPNILPPKEKVQSFWEGIRLNLLDFFSKILP